MGINKNFIVDAGIEVGTSANVVTTLNVGGSANVGGNANVAGNLNVTGITNTASNVNIGGTRLLVGNSTVSVSLASNGLISTSELTFSNNVTINGSLTVQGTTTYINATSLQIGDNIITLNADVPADTNPTQNAGIEIGRGNKVNSFFQWTESANAWQLSANSTTTFYTVHHTGRDVVLGTETSGNYVATITAGSGISGSSSSEGGTPTIAVVAGTELTANSTGVHHNDIARTNNTSSASPNYAGTFTAIDSITTNARGHVTAVNTKTVTMPSSNNTTYTSATVANSAANQGVTRLTSSANANTDTLVVGLDEITVSSNSTAVYVDHTDVARTNTTDGNTSPNYAGTFTAVDSITTNARGHVTAVNTKTVTMPSSNNTTYDLTTVANTAANAGRARLTNSASANDDIIFTGLDEITISSNSTAVYVDHTDVARTNTTDGNTSPNYAGTFTAVDSITTNARGHVTGVNTKTVTMPSSNNTTYTTSTVANTTANQGITRLTSSGNANTDTIILGLDEIVVSSNSTAVYVDHGDVARSDGTSSASPASGGTFTAVDSVTTNARGHVTAINVKTVTLPVDPNTTYDLAAVANTAANAGRLRLTSSSLANDDVIFVGTGTTTVSSNSTQITINSADQYVGTVTSVGGTGSVNGLTLSGTVTTSGSLTLGGSITAANSTTAGIVSLTDSVSSTSTTTAATPNSVKTAYDLANGKAATNQTMYIGTTAVTINRASAALSLTGVNIDGSAGSATNATNSTKVLVTNSDTNTTYRIPMRSGTDGSNCDLLSTAGIYCNPSTDTLFASDYQIPSDIRLKTIVSNITDATATIGKLSTIKYKWNELSGKETTAVHIGVIAQEVEELLPELVTTNPDTGYKTVSYNGLIPLLIESNKEMSGQIEALTSRVHQLEEIINKLMRS